MEHYIFKWWRKRSLGWCVENGEGGAAFIVLEVGSLHMHIWKVIGKSRRNSMLKCT